MLIGSQRCQQPLEDAEIDRGERAEVGQAHAFVHLVDRRIDRAELDDFIANAGDEPAIRRAARARELGRNPGRRAHGLGDDVDEPAAPGQIRRPEAGPGEIEFEPVPREDRLETPRQRFAAAVGAKPEIEHDFERAGDDVRRAGAGMDIGALPCRRREVGIAFVPAHRGEFGQCGGGEMDRVPRELGIGDMALHALDGQRSGQRAAPAVLDHVAEPVDRRRLADDAVIDALARGTELLDNLDRSVDGRALFVGREKESDRAPGIGMRGDESLDGGDERRERTFHVGRAPTVQPTVTFGRGKRVRLPGGERACRHDVRVAGEAHERTCASAAQPAVANAVRNQRLGAKAQWGQPRGDQVLATGIVGGQRAPLDQRTRERKRLRNEALRRGRMGGIHA